jgi:hypothetical protein
MKSDSVVALRFNLRLIRGVFAGVRGGMRVWGRFFVGNRLHAAPSDLLGESPSDDDDDDDDDVLLLFSRCSSPLFPHVALGLIVITITAHSFFRPFASFICPPARVPCTRMLTNSRHECSRRRTG